MTARQEDQAVAARPGRHPRRRAGRSRRARKSANIAETVMPTTRNGRASSQASGHRIKASRAKGQHRTKRMHQATTAMSAFTTLLLRGGTGGEKGCSPGVEWQPSRDETSEALDQASYAATELPDGPAPGSRGAAKRHPLDELLGRTGGTSACIADHRNGVVCLSLRRTQLVVRIFIF